MWFLQGIIKKWTNVDDTAESTSPSLNTEKADGNIIENFVVFISYLALSGKGVSRGDGV